DRACAARTARRGLRVRHRSSCLTSSILMPSSTWGREDARVVDRGAMERSRGSSSKLIVRKKEEQGGSRARAFFCGRQPRRNLVMPDVLDGEAYAVTQVCHAVSGIPTRRGGATHV